MLEDTGSQYFDELQGRSLFQSAFEYDYDDHYFALHDAIHDVARSISDNEYLSISLESDEERHDIPKEVRHLFVKSNSVMTVDHLKFYDPKALHTLIVEGNFLYDKQTSIVNLDSFGCLRAVELRGQNCHPSVSNLKHLRHLHIRKWRNLFQNIQYFLANQEIFIDIGNLLSLQRPSLRGPVAVVFPGDVSVENNELGLMKRACYPPSLDLCKYVESDGILPCLRELTITDNEELSRLPVLPSSLQSLTVKDCTNLTSLSQSLQSLTSLRKLKLSSCPKLQFGQVESLPSKLEDVHISDCSELLLVTGLKNLTSLRKLHLSNCHQLQFGQEESLPSKLEDMHISDCSELLLVTGLKNLTSLRKLHLSNCHQLQFGQEESLPPNLQDLHISDCWKLMLVTGLKNMTSLKSFVLEICPHLQIRADEFLPFPPRKVVITDSLRLGEWCKRRQFHSN